MQILTSRRFLKEISSILIRKKNHGNYLTGVLLTIFRINKRIILFKNDNGPNIF